MTDGYDVEKVMVENERKSGIIVTQRAQLSAQDATITRLKRECEALRKSCGVLRFRLWERKAGVDINGTVVMEHSWSDEAATYRAIVVRIGNGPEGQE